MKNGTPFHVLRNPNRWENSPRAEAIVVAIGSYGTAAAASAALGTFGYAAAVAAVSVGLSLVTSWAVAALTPQPPTPKRSILVNTRDATAPQDIVYGEIRKGGTVTYYETTRGGSVLYQIIALAGHEIESIDALFFNDEELTLSEDGYDNGDRTGAGWVTNDRWTDEETKHEARVFYHLGDQTSITDTFNNSSVESLDSVFFGTGSSDEDSNNFGGSDQPTKESFVGNGIPFIFVRYSFQGEVYSKGLPLVTAKIKGKKVFDPRDNSTAYSNNAALCIRDYLTSGYGLNDSAIDDTVFEVAADACDESVALDAGGTEPRYTINGVVRTDQSYGDVLNSLVTACAGTLFWGAGRWKLVVGGYTAPTKTLTLDDLRSDISLTTRTNLRDQFNRVQGVFTDATNNYIPVDYPPIESDGSGGFLEQDNGVLQSLNLDLPFTTSSPMAQRLAKMTLFRGREQMVFSADFGLNAFDVEVGEIIDLTIDRYGWTNKEFEVIGWNFNTNSDAGDLRVSLQLRETSEAAFDWNAEEIDIISNNTDLEDTLSPVTNLSATSANFINEDGTFVGSIFIDWDSAPGASGYEIESMVNDSVDYDANGGVVEDADATTTREQLVYDAFIEVLYRQPDQNGFDFYVSGGGSGLDDAALREQLADSPEKRSLKFVGVTVKNPTTEYTLFPVKNEVIYFIRVRAFNGLGDTSVWKAVNFTTTKDDTIPGIPTFVSATGGYNQISLRWDNPTDKDFFQTQVYSNSSNTTVGAAFIGSTSGTEFIDTGLEDSQTVYYFLKARDFSGNLSAFSAVQSGTTFAEVPDGTNQTTVTLYQKNTSPTTPPADPSGTFVYTFSTATLSSGTFNGWSQSSPSLNKGEYLWAIVATATSKTDTDTIGSSEFSGAVVVGIGGEDGINGEDGFNVATVNLFNKNTSPTTPPADPSGTFTYTFSSGTLSGGTFNGWSQSAPSLNKGEYLWNLTATAASTSSTDSIPASEFDGSEAVVGIGGEDGAAGDEGPRGPGRWNIPVTTLPTNSTEAQSAWDADPDTPSVPVNSDQAWFYTGTEANPTSQAVFIYDGSVWNEQNEVIDGNLLVTDTVTADKIDVSNLAAIEADLGEVTAGSINTLTSGVGLRVNVASLPNAVYIDQNSTSTYGLFAENLANGGGTVLVESDGGFTTQFLNSLDGSGGFGAYVALDAQHQAFGGGHGQVGVSNTGGGYAFDAIDGGYYDSSGAGYNPFTGKHDGMIDNTVSYELGDIVVDKATIVRKLSDSFTELGVSSSADQKGIVGIVSKVFSNWYTPAAFIDQEATRANQENHTPTPTEPSGDIVTTHNVSDYENDYDLITINAVGEGAVNVCGENGNIEKGDLIVTSNIPGKGMKQADDIVRSYTVAKAREDVTFDNPADVRMIACIYLCG